MSAREVVAEAIAESLRLLGMEAPGVPIILERPREASFGDMSTPVAMALARVLRGKPIEIAEKIAKTVSVPSDVIASVEAARPGFVNFRFALPGLQRAVRDVLDDPDHYGASSEGRGRRAQVEYVSANPTGPLVIVSARAAAVGSALLNLMDFTGYEAQGEYFVNDHGKQIEALGESLRFRLKERLRLVAPGEEIGQYPGDYLAEIAARLDEGIARRWIETNEPAANLGRQASDHLLEAIKSDLERYGARFESFFRESSLHPLAIQAALDRLIEAGFTYERDGAVFFRSSELGDEKDRVLKKSDGDPTYFLADIAYHRNKLERGFDRAVWLLGPDHHGHVPRMKAAMSALGAPDDWLEIMIVGWVRLLEEGKPVAMSKRAGEFVTMRELIDDVGVDVAKYFFLMRRANSPLDFDLTLARKQSDENPVYYVQYAHARIASVIRFAEERGVAAESSGADLSRLAAEEERALMVHLVYFPNVVEGAAQSLEPHRLTTYAQELATAFHQFYHEHRIVGEDAAVSGARLGLARATKSVLKNTLGLLGVSAPSSM